MRQLLSFDRARLNTLLTEHLRRVAGCHGVTIVVGASRDVGHGGSNWLEFLGLVPTPADGPYVRAVAGGVVSEARELQRPRRLEPALRPPLS